MMTPEQTRPLGVAIVSYNAADVIEACLDSLAEAGQADGVALRIAVLDNASTDDSAARIAAWRGPAEVTLLRAASNGGFAAGVNGALRHLMGAPELDRVWILNPDSLVPRGTPGRLARAPGGFGLMGGRIFYHDEAGQQIGGTIQVDGGRIDPMSGVTQGLNLGRRHNADAPVPLPAADSLDFLSGAHLCVSRRFWERVGPMDEGYFLYYEEVDWARRRGDLPLRLLEGAEIYHRAGTSIGSATLTRRAAPMALYFLHRARHRFMARAYPRRWPMVWAHSLAKLTQHIAQGDPAGAAAILRGAAGMAPPAAVARRLGPDVVDRLRGIEHPPGPLSPALARPR